ncbi:hypothetical protein HGA64_01260 [Candidatus Falkowbacteria bacterium]|nr:hypothetical protein [Candidatus Falkowbacteria bacterium]
MGVKSIFPLTSLTSDFELISKGFYQVIQLGIIPFAIYRKDRKILIQFRRKEWRRQREENFVKLNGMTYTESRQLSHAAFIEMVNRHQQKLESVGLLQAP